MPSNHPFNIDKNLKESKPFLCAKYDRWTPDCVGAGSQTKEIKNQKSSHTETDFMCYDKMVNIFFI